MVLIGNGPSKGSQGMEATQSWQDRKLTNEEDGGLLASQLVARKQTN